MKGDQVFWSLEGHTVYGGLCRAATNYDNQEVYDMVVVHKPFPLCR